MSTECVECQKPALLNGYCASHQYMAIENMLKLIHDLERKLGSLKDADPEALTELVSQIKRTKDELRNTRSLCERTEDCRAEIEIRHLITAMDQIIQRSDLSQSGEKLIKNTQSGLFGNSMAVHTENESKVKSIMLEEEVNRTRQIATEADILQRQSDLQKVLQDNQIMQSETVRLIEAQQAEMQRIKEQKEAAEKRLTEMEARLDEFRGEASQSTGAFTKAFVTLRDEKKTFEDLYHEMMKREELVSARVKAIQDQATSLGKQLVSMKARYEQQLVDSQRQFAASMVVGGQVLSEREEALMKQIEMLTGALQESKRVLKGVSSDNKELLNKDTNTARIARQLLDVKSELTSKQAEIADMQAKLSESRGLVAQNEIRCEQQNEQATGKIREELSRLADKNIRLQKELTERQEQAITLQNQLYDLQRQLKLDVAAKENEVQRLRSESENLRRQRDQTKAEMQNLTDMQRQKLQHDEMQMKLRFDQAKQNLQEQFRERKRELEIGLERKNLQLQEEKRALELAKKQEQETLAQLKRKNDEFERTRATFEERQQSYLREKAELEAAAMQGRMLLKQSTQMEEDHKNRIRTLEQRLQLAQQRGEGRVKQLDEELKLLKANRNDIITRLEGCESAREDLIRKMASSTAENLKLKDHHAQLKTKMDKMRTEYETMMTKLQLDATRLQRDSSVCYSKLQDASLVHDHTMRARAELEEQLEMWKRKYKEAAGNEQAMRSMERDVHLSKSKVLQLQAAMKESDVAKATLIRNAEQAQTELNDTKRRESTLLTERQYLAEELKRLMINNEADMERRRAQMEAREASAMAQLSDEQRKNKEYRMQIMALQGQKEMSQNMLINEQLEHIEQTQAMVAAQQLQDTVTFGGATILPAVTGRSSLVQM